MDDLTGQRLEILIPFADHVQNYGVHATTHHTASRITLRVTADWRARVAKTAKLLNMDETDYIRTAVMNVTKAIENKEKENAQHDNRSG